MLSEGYTTITISEEAASTLAEIVVVSDFESVADVVDYGTNETRDPETLSDAELAHLLYRRLAN